MEDDSIGMENELRIKVSVGKMAVSVWKMTVSIWDILSLGSALSSRSMKHAPPSSSGVSGKRPENIEAKYVSGTQV